MTKTPYFGPAAPRLGPPHIWRANGPLLLLIGLLLFVACRKDDPDPPPPPPPVAEKPDTLPPMTTVGANTFGCYLNGKLWLPKADWKAYFDPSFNNIQCFLDDADSLTAGYLTLSYSVEGKQKWLSIDWPKNLYYTDTFYTNAVSAKDRNAFNAWYAESVTTKRYYSDGMMLNKNNKLIITHFDPANNIISGTLKVTLYRASDHKNIIDRKDSIVITDGRFDIRYRD